jgi:hypothetical protein
MQGRVVMKAFDEARSGGENEDTSSAAHASGSLDEGTSASKVHYEYGTLINSLFSEDQTDSSIEPFIYIRYKYKFIDEYDDPMWSVTHTQRWNFMDSCWSEVNLEPATLDSLGQNITLYGETPDGKKHRLSEEDFLECLETDKEACNRRNSAVKSELEGSEGPL